MPASRGRQLREHCSAKPHKYRMRVTFYFKYIYTVLIHAQIKNISQFYYLAWLVLPVVPGGERRNDGKYNAGH